MISKNGLAGWWKFDETKGKVANDSSGKKRNGELKNFDSDTAQWVKGPVGNALRFDGKNDYVDVGDFEWGGECSFSGWVKYNKIQLWSRVFDFSNGKEVKLGNDEINALEEAINNLELPETSGFFFGSDSYTWDSDGAIAEEEKVQSDYYHKASDLEFVAEARKLLAEGFEVYYNSSW